MTEPTTPLLQTQHYGFRQGRTAATSLLMAAGRICRDSSVPAGKRAESSVSIAAQILVAAARENTDNPNHLANGLCSALAYFLGGFPPEAREGLLQAMTGHTRQLVADLAQARALADGPTEGAA